MTKEECTLESKSYLESVAAPTPSWKNMRLSRQKNCSQPSAGPLKMWLSSRQKFGWPRDVNHKISN